MELFSLGKQVLSKFACIQYVCGYTLDYTYMSSLAGAALTSFKNIAAVSFLWKENYFKNSKVTLILTYWPVFF